MGDGTVDVGRWDTSRWTLIYGSVVVGAALLGAVVWNGRWYTVVFAILLALGTSWSAAERKRRGNEPLRPDVAPHITAEIEERKQQR